MEHTFSIQRIYPLEVRNNEVEAKLFLKKVKQIASSGRKIIIVDCFRQEDCCKL